MRGRRPIVAVGFIAILGGATFLLARNTPVLLHFLGSAGDIPPLHRAAEAGNVERVKKLVRWGIPVDTTDRSNRTALMLAAQEGHTAVAAVLLAHGADPNRQAGGLVVGSAFTEAIEQGDPELVRLMLEHGANPNSEDGWGTPALHNAATQGARVTGLLLDHGADPNILGSLDYRPLHIAARSGDCGAIEPLLERGADVSARDHEGATALHDAADHCPEAMIRALLTNGATVGAVEEHGWTPLHIAARGGNIAAVRLLVDAGANVNARDRHDGTPADVALSADQVETAAELERYGGQRSAVRRFYPFQFEHATIPPSAYLPVRLAAVRYVLAHRDTNGALSSAGPPALLLQESFGLLYQSVESLMEDRPISEVAPPVLQTFLEAGFPCETHTGPSPADDQLRIIFYTTTFFAPNVAVVRLSSQAASEAEQHHLLILRRVGGKWSVLQEGEHVQGSRLITDEGMQAGALEAYLAEGAPYPPDVVYYMGLGDCSSGTEADRDPPTDWLARTAREYGITAKPNSAFPQSARESSPNATGAKEAQDPDGPLLYARCPISLGPDYAVLEFMWYKGPLYAYGFWYFFERIDGKWTLTAVRFAWIS